MLADRTRDSSKDIRWPRIHRTKCESQPWQRVSLTGFEGVLISRRSAICAGVWTPQDVRPFSAVAQQTCLKSFIVAQGRSVCVPLDYFLPAFFRHVCA